MYYDYFYVQYLFKTFVIEIVKIAAQKWSVFDPKLKEKLIQQYKEEAIDYGKVLNQYENSLTQEQKTEIKRAHQHSLDVKEIKKTKKVIMILCY